RKLAAFPHRMAMVALACADHEEFVPSLAEAGEDLGGHQISYSVDTVRHFRHQLHAHEHLYFIMGADQFLGIATWKDYETLLGSCDFIVANRPGFDIGMLRLVIPPELLGRHKATPAPEDPAAIGGLHSQTGPIPVKADALRPELRCAIEAAHNKKAGSVTLLDLAGLGAFTGYFLICTGFSERQVAGIATEI